MGLHTALVTGFDAFGGDAINPSYLAVHGLPARIGKLNVVTAQLPTSFARATRKLATLIAREQPDIVVCVGLAAEREAISIERLAVNLAHARIADNDGKRPQNKAVVTNGPAAYFATLPVIKIVDALTRAGFHAELSLSAGTFVCNQVFYQLMHHAALGQGRSRITRAGFVHVPALPAVRADGALLKLTHALELILRVAQRNR